MKQLARNSSLFILCGIILFHLINNLIWFYFDGYAVHGCHSVWHEKLSLESSHVLKDSTVPLIKKIIVPSQSFQLARYRNSFCITNFSLTNLFLLIPHITSFDGHIKLLLIYLTNFIQFVCVLLALVWLGTVLFNGVVGLWSGIILSFYPGIIGLSRKVNIGLMTTICIILFTLFLVRWKRYHRITWAILLALLLWVGILSSPLFFAYGIPLLFFHVVYVMCCDKKRAQRFIALAIFAIICFFVFNCYSGGSYEEICSNVTQNLKEAYEKLVLKSDSFIGSAKDGLIESFLFAPQDSSCPCTQTTNVGFNLKTYLFYIIQCIRYSSPLFFIMGILSFCLLLGSKSLSRYAKSILLVLIFGSYFILSMYHIKWGKFCTPMLPVFALSTSYVIAQRKNWTKTIKGLIIILGICTTLYYSYIPYPGTHYLEKLTEGLVSHRPLSTSFVPIAEKTGKTIMNTTDIKGDIRIAFIDRDSSRFQGDWVTDKSVRIGLLADMFIPTFHTMEYFWNVDDYSMDFFGGHHFFVVITHEKVKDMYRYLFPHDEKDEKYRLLIVDENRVNESTFLYVVRIHVLTS